VFKTHFSGTKKFGDHKKFEGTASEWPRRYGPTARTLFSGTWSNPNNRHCSCNNGHRHRRRCMDLSQPSLRSSTRRRWLDWRSGKVAAGRLRARQGQLCLSGQITACVNDGGQLVGPWPNFGRWTFDFKMARDAILCWEAPHLIKSKGTVSNSGPPKCPWATKSAREPSKLSHYWFKKLVD